MWLSSLILTSWTSAIYQKRLKMESKNNNLVFKVLCLELRQHIAPVCFFACLFRYIYFYCELCYRGFQKTLMSQVNFLHNPNIVFWKTILLQNTPWQ